MFKVVRILVSGTWSFTYITDIGEAMNTLIQEGHNHSKYCITVKVTRRTQTVEISLQRKDLVLHSLVRIWETILEVMLVLSLA